MDIEYSKMGNVVVTTVREARVDAASGGDLHHALCRCIDAGENKIVLDLSEVNFIDSTGLGALVASLKHMGKTGQLVLCGLGDAVITLFRLTRMDKIFRLFPDPAAAVSALAEA